MRVGISRMNITPALGMSMAGFRERDHGAESIHDLLYATCYVFEDEVGQRAAFVTCDLINIDGHVRDKVLEQLSGKSKLSAEAILIQATHTHSGPSACALEGRNYLDAKRLPKPEEKAYYSFLIESLVQGILQAEADLNPAKIGFAVGSLQTLGNNRNEPECYMDDSVNVVKIDSLEGKCRGLIVNFACHPTVLTYTSYTISADFPGAMRRQLSAVIPDAVIAYSQGAAGNISTRFTRRESSVEEMERLALGLSGEVLKLLSTMTMQETLHLQTALRKVKLPVKAFKSDDLCEREITEGKALLNQLKNENADQAQIRKAYVSLQGYERNLMIKKNIGDLKEIETMIQVIDTGLFQWITLPGEAFSEIAEAIKIKPAVIVCGYANDYVGYILSKEGYSTHGYEVGVSYLGENAQAILISESLTMLKEMGLTA